ncbi:hypothetical protein EGR_11230 [Echinococcus granulosus]|uniref:Uncharacterized protein n=1 Tax=Echinococcus granulosus TaxID=6210 RepID=W6TYV6_ECHGR|nr:hypothetical protein EGR_11230 [Echinococcus granulosus]EUB53913.1 hypothetical protein EGR_11230 [Echinococcus granulosus]
MNTHGDVVRPIAWFSDTFLDLLSVKCAIILPHDSEVIQQSQR